MSTTQRARRGRAGSLHAIPSVGLALMTWDEQLETGRLARDVRCFVRDTLINSAPRVLLGPPSGRSRHLIKLSPPLSRKESREREGG